MITCRNILLRAPGESAKLMKCPPGKESYPSEKAGTWFRSDGMLVAVLPDGLRFDDVVVELTASDDESLQEGKMTITTVHGGKVLWPRKDTVN